MFYAIWHSERVDLEDRDQYYKDIASGYSPTDSNITQNGYDIAYKTGLFLKNQLLNTHNTYKNVLVISSPYLRCIQTSTSIIEGIGKDL